ncbi:MAG: hypothetical protein WAR77_07625 [Saprospiraceae bacterium]
MPPKIHKSFQGIQYYFDSSDNSHKSLYDRLLRLFKELLLASSGDVNYTLDWLQELDRKFGIFKLNYGMSDFFEELKKNGLLQETNAINSQYSPSSKLEIEIRKNAFESLFGKIRKSSLGKHKTKQTGAGDENSESIRPFQYGDNFQQINTQESIKNAFIRNGAALFQLNESDLISHERFQQAQCSTVLMIDISHSMILYGEDRITPAKKVALALSHMIQNYYPKDKLDFVVFGDDAWQIELKDLPYLEVGPYHTNTVAGLNLAIEILNKRKTSNKHIMMITDGKPSCIKRGKEYYKNSFGLDRIIVSRTLALARKCRKQNIDVTTFMVTTDPYLVEFVEQFSKEANGKALYTNLDGLGEHILINYERNKRKKTGR